MLQLARDRWAHFACVEIWDDSVCVLRLPPAFAERGLDGARASALAEAR
jgi:hypothetical protein